MSSTHKSRCCLDACSADADPKESRLRSSFHDLPMEGESRPMVGVYVISVAAVIWMLLVAAVHRTWLAGTCVTGVFLLGAVLVEIKNIVFSGLERVDILHVTLAISLIVLLELFRIEWPVRRKAPEASGGFPYLPSSREGFRRELLLFLGAFLPAVFFSGRFLQAAVSATGEIAGFTAMHYLELTFATLAWVLATTFFIRFVAVAHEAWTRPRDDR